MALRVLLADESSTIKKVFQLALQDFAVDVRPVNIGTDVEHVARDFQPDLIFADVMLQKRSGYEVASDLKQSKDLREIPVILMYSGFIDIDEDKFQASHANAQLEKPFEVAALRKLVTDLVPRTQNQRLSQFLSFPKMPEMEDQRQPPRAAPAPEHAREEFEQVSIPKMRQHEKYRVDLKPEDMDPSNVPVDFSPEPEPVNVDPIPRQASAPAEEEFDDNFSFSENTQAQPTSKPRPSGEIELEPFADDHEFRNLMNAGASPVKSAPSQAPTPQAAPTPRPTPAAAAPTPRPAPQPAPPVTAMPPPEPAPKVPSLDLATIEKIVREQAAQAIENAVWKIVPDLAAQIIERELDKLLREREASPR